eukprot:2026490-Pleurochrysis_carterae.AAC.2
MRACCCGRRSELNDKVREVDDLTDMLIEAKLSQAEMNGEVLGTKHDLRRAEIKVPRAQLPATIRRSLAAALHPPPCASQRRE